MKKLVSLMVFALMIIGALSVLFMPVEAIGGLR
jgi:hypothetical protein